MLDDPRLLRPVFCSSLLTSDDDVIKQYVIGHRPQLQTQGTLANNKQRPESVNSKRQQHLVQCTAYLQLPTTTAKQSKQNTWIIIHAQITLKRYSYLP